MEHRQEDLTCLLLRIISSLHAGTSYHKPFQVRSMQSGVYSHHTWTGPGLVAMAFFLAPSCGWRTGVRMRIEDQFHEFRGKVMCKIIDC